jgi:DNA modification methylase
MNRFIFGEALKEMDKLIEKRVKVDAIVCDPPYGTTQCKWDTIIPFIEMWKRIVKIRKENVAVILFGSEPFSSALRMSNIKEYKHDWVWNKILKTGHLNAGIQPLLQHEMIHKFYKSVYYPQMEQGNPVHSEGNRDKPILNNSYGSETRNYKDRKGETEKYPSTLSMVFPKRHSSVVYHPNEKPVELMEYIIKTYTEEGDTVLDFTCGSGSTGVGCRNTNRNFIGIDNGFCDKPGKFLGWAWVDIAKWRVENEVSQKELF